MAECPEHGLTLVQRGELAREQTPAPERVTFFGDPRLGRGVVLLGASLVSSGFVAPLVRVSGIVASALQVAIDGAVNLWLVPGAALVVLWVLWQRRDAQSMRAARLAVFALAVAGSMPLFYTRRRVALMAEIQAADVTWLWGFSMMAVGLAVIAFGSARLGSR